MQSNGVDSEDAIQGVLPDLDAIPADVLGKSRLLILSYPTNPTAFCAPVALFEQAWMNRLPLMLKGPTGTGKSRFVEHMAARLGRPLGRDGSLDARLNRCNQPTPRRPAMMLRWI